ncbi:MAG: hypothetical protein U5K29_08440 [Acidimicrobiales bacterium]|nr:hypothetical protein [Acidimicrobiales bacterium]
MGRPQEPELQRSGNTPLDPDHMQTEVSTQPTAPRDEPGSGPVPAENQPGHHPADEQDKPDLDEFAEALGVHDDTDGSEAGLPAQLRSVVSSARDLAEPVAQKVQTKVTKATQTLDEWRHLVERVDQLEREVADLRDQVERGKA